MRGTVSFLVALLVVSGDVVCHIGDSWTPVETVLTLRFPPIETVKTYVHGFNKLGENSAVYEAGSSGVVGLDGRLWLGPIHSSEGVLNGTIALAVMKSPPSLDSAVEDMTNLMI